MPEQGMNGTNEFLVIDASTREIAVGVLGAAGWLELQRSPGDALESLFRLTRDALAGASRELKDLDGVLFCSGPGSLLGLRLAAMAVSTWRTLPELRHWNHRHYHSLALAAAGRQIVGERDFHVLSPFRKEQFNHLAIRNGKRGDLDLLDAESVAALDGTVYFVPNGTLPVSAPEGSRSLAYQLDHLPEAFERFPGLFRPSDRPEVYVPRAPVFATWTAQRHRK